MIKYFKYLKYLIEHKKNVAIECFKSGQYLHAFTHDLSKFLPDEFIPYARFFYGEKTDRAKTGFEMAWTKHQRRNKHHWNYWLHINDKGGINPLPMPEKYVKQMLADWSGMSRKFGDTPLDYYNKSKNRMILHEETIELVERHLIWTFL